MGGSAGKILQGFLVCLCGGGGLWWCRLVPHPEQQMFAGADHDRCTKLLQ